MIEQSLLSLALALSASRIAFSSSLNNCGGVGQIGRVQSDEKKRTHPLFRTFLHRLQAALSLGHYAATAWNIGIEYRRNAGDRVKES